MTMMIESMLELVHTVVIVVATIIGLSMLVGDEFECKEIGSRQTWGLIIFTITSIAIITSIAAIDIFLLQQQWFPQ